jgi:hypothetical protein
MLRFLQRLSRYLQVDDAQDAGGQGCSLAAGASRKGKRHKAIVVMYIVKTKTFKTHIYI